jgi:AAA+ ATPase superfamily predicted ATPase
LSKHLPKIRKLSYDNFVCGFCLVVETELREETAMFYGRQEELNLLNEKYSSTKGELIVVYGRRRVGKSKLLAEFSKGKKVFSCEGLEGERTPRQLAHFVETMEEQLNDPALKGTRFSDWKSIFSYLTQWMIRQEGRTGLRISN